MTKSSKRPTIRVLVVDDDPAILVAYRQVLNESVPSNDRAAIDDLRERLFASGTGRHKPVPAAGSAASFEAIACNGAEAAVAAVREACAEGKPISVAFLDMRMPPGPDGAWAAERIRELDPKIEIVICTAYSDVDPAEIGRRVPPPDKLFYLQKPFHPHEVRQLALALGEKRAGAEQRDTQLTEFDLLTGLPGRARFIVHLKEAVSEAAASGYKLAVLHVDLDNFRRVNDALGLVAGDELLRLVARQVRESLRRDDVVSRARRGGAAEDVARIGGDQFMVLLHAIGNARDAAAVAERLTNPLVATTPLNNRSLSVTASVGIAVYPTDSQDDDALLRHASIAMHGARRRGPGQYAFYDEAMHAGAQTRLKLEAQLRTALEKGEFTLHYQPQFDLGTGKISGIEALLRWNNSELGAVSPDVFIPVAEEIGVILPIGEWVLRSACRQAKVWQQGGLPDMRIAVNVSCLQFTQPGFATLVAEVLKETGLEPRTLELEITESLLMKNEEWTGKLLTELRALGVSVAIDDFGIGYSSLGRLNDFPVNRLKIDRSFVQGVGNGGRPAPLVAAILSMAKALGLDVVAEGVEDFNQLLHLQDQHCNEVQGYLLSKPLQAEQVTELLERLVNSDAGSRTMRLRSLAG